VEGRRGGKEGRRGGEEGVGCMYVDSNKKDFHFEKRVNESKKQKKSD
jgi:hypothetical protein